MQAKYANDPERLQVRTAAFPPRWAMHPTASRPRNALLRPAALCRTCRSPRCPTHPCTHPCAGGDRQGVPDRGREPAGRLPALPGHHPGLHRPVPVRREGASECKRFARRNQGRGAGPRPAATAAEGPVGPRRTLTVFPSRAPALCRSALSNVADEGLLSDGFFWIPSLAGPTTVNVSRRRRAPPSPLLPRKLEAAVLRRSRRRALSRRAPRLAPLALTAPPPTGPPPAAQGGLGWLFSWENGAPQLGWQQTGAYLVLPILLIVSQASPRPGMAAPRVRQRHAARGASRCSHVRFWAARPPLHAVRHLPRSLSTAAVHKPEGDQPAAAEPGPLPAEHPGHPQISAHHDRCALPGTRPHSARATSIRPCLPGGGKRRGVARAPAPGLAPNLCKPATTPTSTPCVLLPARLLLAQCAQRPHPVLVHQQPDHHRAAGGRRCLSPGNGWQAPPCQRPRPAARHACRAPSPPTERPQSGRGQPARALAQPPAHPQGLAPAAPPRSSTCAASSRARSRWRPAPATPPLPSSTSSRWIRSPAVSRPGGGLLL